MFSYRSLRTQIRTKRYYVRRMFSRYRHPNTVPSITYTDWSRTSLVKKNLLAMQPSTPISAYHHIKSSIKLHTHTHTHTQNDDLCVLRTLDARHATQTDKNTEQRQRNMHHKFVNGNKNCTHGEHSFTYIKIVLIVTKIRHTYDLFQ